MKLSLNHHKDPLGPTWEQIPAASGSLYGGWECPSPCSGEGTIIHQSRSFPQGFPRTSSPVSSAKAANPFPCKPPMSQAPTPFPAPKSGWQSRRGDLEDPSVFRRQCWMVAASSATLHLSFTRFCDLRMCVKSSATINSNIQVWLFKLLFQKYFKMH